VVRVVEAVPNFSEGRDPSFVAAAGDVFSAAGCEVLDATMDPDHHRSVVTVLGSPRTIERGSVAAAGLALSRIDLRGHSGVHPRVGALDVLPLVPLHGIEMDEVVQMAHRIGSLIAGLGIPVHLYGHASRPPGRTLAAIRRGVQGGPDADLPGLDDSGRTVHRRAHPMAGACCIGAREVLLAWNVDVEGLTMAAAREIATQIREADGGFHGLRALAFRLLRQGRLQVSMNLEDPSRTHPIDVFRTIRARAERLQGTVVGTEVIGLAPDQLGNRAAAAEMKVRDWSPDRVLGHRLEAYLRARRG